MHGRFFTTETVLTLTWMIPVSFKLSSWSKKFTLTSGFWSHIAPQVLTFRAGKQKMCLAQFVLIPSCTAFISGLRLLAQFHIAPQEWNLELQETKDTWIRISKNDCFILLQAILESLLLQAISNLSIERWVLKIEAQTLAPSSDSLFFPLLTRMILFSYLFWTLQVSGGGASKSLRLPRVGVKTDAL